MITKLRELRLTNNVTQKELSTYCNVCERTLRYIEKGERTGKPDFWIKAASFFSTTVEDLYDYKDVS